MSNKNPKYIVGIHSCLEAIKANYENIECAFASKSFKNIKILNFIKTKKINLKFVESGFLKKIYPESQGVALKIKKDLEFNESKIYVKDRSIIVVLDGITDPQNLGAMLRTCWLLDVDGVILSKHRSCSLNPTVYKVASGGASYVPVMKTSSIGKEIFNLKGKGYFVYALENKKGSESIREINFHKKVVLIVGSEGDGIREGILKKSDKIIMIPQKESQASLNASVSLAIALNEVRNY